MHLNGTDADVHALLVVLVKLALADDSPDAAAWRADGLAVQRRLGAGRGTVEAPRLNTLWYLAVEAAESDPIVQRLQTVSPTLPTTSPLSFADLEAKTFALDAALECIRNASSSG